MSLAEKRHYDRAKDVFKAHPDYGRIALDRVFGKGKVIANLVKEIGWLRGIERRLDVVVLEHLVEKDLVQHLEGNRYGITSRGQKLIAKSAAKCVDGRPDDTRVGGSPA